MAATARPGLTEATIIPLGGGITNTSYRVEKVKGNDFNLYKTRAIMVLRLSTQVM